MRQAVVQVLWALSLYMVLGGCVESGQVVQPPERVSQGEAMQKETVQQEAVSEEVVADEGEDKAVVEEGAGAAVPEPRLHLYVDDYRIAYRDPDQFVLDVFFENLGRAPVVVLPSLIHRQYQPLGETSATYVPSPGPHISPWEGAFTLKARETRGVRITGMRDADGVWALEGGNYRMALLYMVGEELAATSPFANDGLGIQEAAVWVGELESREITVRYEPSEQLGLQ